MTLTADITTADLQAEYDADSFEVTALRELARYRQIGAETWMLPGADLGLWYDLRDAGMLTATHEPNGNYSADGWTPEEVLVWRITERGLEELVIHGRER